MAHRAPATGALIRTAVAGLSFVRIAFNDANRSESG
jgi:hypothetical protein